MTTLTLRLNKEEEQIFNSISTIKQLALEKIEDEYDLQLIKDFESREEKGEVNLIEFDDLKKEFDL